MLEDLINESREQIADVEEKLANGEFMGDSGVYVGGGDMPEDCYVQIDPTGESTSSLLCNALKGNKSGEAILFDDVSPLEHTVKVKAKKKNLLSYPYYDGTSITSKNVVFTVDESRNIVLNGTSVGGENFRLWWAHPLEAGQYTFSADMPNLNGLVIYVYDETNYKVLSSLDGAKKSITINLNSPILINLYINTQSALGALNNVKVSNIQLEYGSTATGYAPYVEDITECKVLKYGKNILNNDLFKNADNWNKQFQGYGIYYYRLPVPNGVYTISMPADATYQFKVMDVETPTFNNIWAEVHNGMVTNTSPKTLTITTGYITFSVNNDNNKLEKIAQVECASSASAFEPYTEPVAYPINADGTVGITSRYPSMTLMSDPQGLTLDCEYNRDINKVIAKLEAALK